MISEFQKDCNLTKNGTQEKSAVPTVKIEDDVFYNDGGPRTKYTLARELIKSPRSIRKSYNNHNVGNFLCM